MISFLNYLVEANLILLVCGLFYILLLKRESDITYRRFFIVLACLVILVAPLIRLNNKLLPDVPVLSEIPVLILPELHINGSTTEAYMSENESGTTIVTMIQYFYKGYWAVTLLLTLLLLTRLFQIAKLFFSPTLRVIRQGNIRMIHTHGVLPTFSFLHFLFFDNTITLSDEERESIIHHETIHINQAHSLDVFVLEAMVILFWFNPITWYWRKEIQDLHEYLADDKVVKNTDAQQYTSLLAKMALNQAHLAIGHPFSKSTIIKRIEMMNTIKKKVKIWKALLAIPTVCLVIFVVSCNEEVVKDLNTFEEVALQSSMPSELNGKLAELQRQYPKADFTYIETEGITKEDFKRLSSSIDPGSIAYIKTFEEENKTGIIVSKNGPIRSTPDVDGVYMIVEESAMPQGGYESFYNRIATKLLYPTQARKLGVEGKVYVQFVIDESGNVMQLEVVKGIGAGCDKAAMEAIAQAGPWTPPTVDGKSVKQRIILPISFSLTGEPQLPKGAKG